MNNKDSRTDAIFSSDEEMEAAFIEGLIAVAYKPSIKTALEQITDGHAKVATGLGSWYLDLSPESKRKVRQLMKIVSQATLFNTMAYLDGVAGTLIFGKVMEIDLRLRFRDTESSTVEEYAISPSSSHRHLHDSVQQQMRKKRKVS
jgi:hypothetical protein